MGSIFFFIRVTFLFTEIYGYFHSIKIFLFVYKEDVKLDLTPKPRKSDWYSLKGRNN